MSGAGRRPRPAVLARLAAVLVGLYPRCWRERYGDELLGWTASLLLAGAAGEAGAVTAARRGELGLGMLRFGTVAAAVVAAAMVVILAATVTWGMVLRSVDPALFHSHEGVRASSTAGAGWRPWR